MDLCKNQRFSLIFCLFFNVQNKSNLIFKITHIFKNQSILSTIYDVLIHKKKNTHTHKNHVKSIYIRRSA